MVTDNLWSLPIRCHSHLSNKHQCDAINLPINSSLLMGSLVPGLTSGAPRPWPMRAQAPTLSHSCSTLPAMRSSRRPARPVTVWWRSLSKPASVSTWPRCSLSVWSLSRRDTSRWWDSYVTWNTHRYAEHLSGWFFFIFLILHIQEVSSRFKRLYFPF